MVDLSGTWEGPVEGWYRLRFLAPAEVKDYPFLEFAPVDCDAEVWLNGDFLGIYPGGFEPFAFPVTLQAENLLEVQAAALPPSVALVHRPHLCVTSLQVTPYLADGYGQAELVVQVAVENYSDRPITEPLRILVAPHNFQGGGGIRHPLIVTFPPGRSAHTFTVTLKRPELWWTGELGAPSLYKALILIGGEAVPQAETLFGVREFRRGEDGALWLNGRRADVEMMRVAAHVEPAEFYGRSDEEGILVCQDLSFPDSDVQRACALARAAVRLLHNHPSVVMLSAYTGSQKLDQALVRAVMAVDRTRPVVTGG